MKQFLFVVCLVGLCMGAMFSSCGRSTSAEPLPLDTIAVADSAVAYYLLQSQGKYEAYVSKMHSCDSMPDDYKKRTVLMLKQHQAFVEKTKQGVKGAKVIRTEFHQEGKMANVFLEVTFCDNSQEEVMFPMVYDNNRWWVQ